MRKFKILAAVTLSLTLAMGPAAYAQPTSGSDNLVIDSTGPSGEDADEPDEEAPGLVNGVSQNTTQQPGTDASSTAGSLSGTVAQPTIQSEGAVLLDAATGTVLYGKNENTQFYPASITKLMTGLLVVENCSLDDKVTFSKSATTNLEAGSVSLNLTEGDVLSVNDCLYALLLKSANEVANGLAEKVSGSVSAFADKMNARAKELGCKNTHFVNPNGLNSTEHYTTPYDMALIARAAFSNDTLRKIDTTLSHKIPATKKVNQERTVTMGHKMFYTTDSRYYPGIIGGKTGYTSKAGNTLVTGVDRDGVRLIAVVMKRKGTHYADTKALLDYGFANRDKLLASGGQPSNGSTANPSNGSTANPSNGSPAGPSGGEGTNGSAPTAAQAGTWQIEGENHYYIKADGTRAAGEWMEIGGEEYWFDTNAVMATGWRQFTNGDWYYFGTNGAMVKEQWVQNTGKWFYLGKNGTMLKNTTTPDGYEVGENGARK